MTVSNRAPGGAFGNRSIIVPVTIAYKNIEQEPVSAANRDLIYWYGDADTDFLSHFWKFLALRSVEVVVTIQPQVECCRYEDTSAGRKKLAEDCFDRVLGLITEKIHCRKKNRQLTSGDRQRYFPVNCFFMFSTNSLSMESAFFRIMG